MRTLLSIIKQELRERIFSWITLIFFLMLVFQGIWYTKGTFDYFVNEGVLMNASSIFYRNFAGMGMLMIIIIAISTGGVLYKDIQHKSAQWVYALPVQEKLFFVGRFLAAFFYLSIVSTGFIVGMYLTPYSGIGEAQRFGPTPWGQMLHGWLIFTLPNLLFYVALVFFAVVFSRRIALSYLAVFVVVIGFLICQTSYDTGGKNPWYILGDPGGYVAAQHYSDLLSPAEKNTAYFQLKGYLLQNRLLWLAVTVLLSLLAYRRFNFKYFIQASTSPAKKIHTDEPVSSIPVDWQTPNALRRFATSDFVRKLLTLSRLEFLNIVRPASFKIILGIIMIMIFMQNVTWNAAYYIGNELPLSSNMTYFRLQWGVFIVMLVMIWAGELFFKDKTVNIWQITDTLPVPVWVTLLSRFVAIMGLALVLSVSFIFISLLCQVILGGGGYIDLSRFVEDLLTYRWGFLNFVLYTALVFFVAALTGQRLLTHILAVGYFLFTIISFDMGLMEQIRYGYALVPGIEDYSDISGYGIFQKAANWFFFLWLTLAVFFVLMGILLWNRGTGRNWKEKFLLKSKQLNIGWKMLTLLCFGGFIGLQSFIAAQVYQNGNFTAEVEQERLDAEYEKKYKYLATKAQPSYQKVDLIIDLFPKQRRASYSAKVILSNRQAVDSLFLNWKDFVKVTRVKINDETVSPVKTDAEQNLSVYLIPLKYQKDSLLHLYLEAEKQYIGFSQSEFQSDLTFNGSFGSVKDFLPHLGYAQEKELQENRIRAEHALPKLSSRMADLQDRIALQQDALATDAVWVSGSITISTDASQVPFATGSLLKRMATNQRQVAHYRIDKPQPFNWYLGSALYNTLKGKSLGLEYQILYHPAHPFNVPLYQDALTKATQFLQKNAGFKGLDFVQLVEINKWQDDQYTGPNLIALAEKEGWVADSSGLQEKAYLYQSIGSNLARLWVQQNVFIANVQGADMLKIALPEALSLKFVEKSLGKTALELLIQKKRDRYGKDRNNEPNQEPSLLYADGADYLEINKGAIELYRLLDKIGLAKFNQIVVAWMQREPQQPKTFATLYHALKEAAPAGALEEKVWETVE